jgi:hypothetical protein
LQVDEDIEERLEVRWRCSSIRRMLGAIGVRRGVSKVVEGREAVSGVARPQGIEG